ncbi:FAR1 DNA binding domain, Zinc finger, SWIM-type, MULE transposase domain, FHY3/FAR1 family [Artemisia annua]|uniref:FAR1 DNA binding domain, Zinc finger, SWIM-type, MULE transposase domain, FHY3/FAR1 family n=1 Tax=Artemisia annua TaxID=35608 RepID=A0A2U1MXJ7_ARTAN|nr:FAR1 DNA binding domain, Zinc finger, SWIM-type, MULE transposase domain, FHY3/FAR1 family [Artemisia annua]
MDRMTASICEKPYGRATFARVLVEIDSELPLVGCEDCKIFGHYPSDCQNKVNVARKVDKDGENVKPSETKNGNNGTASGKRLVFGAAVYYIWQERNLRLFQKKFRSEEAVFKIIVDIVRHKLLSLRIKRSVESVKAADIWKIPLMSSKAKEEPKGEKSVLVVKKIKQNKALGDSTQSDRMVQTNSFGYAANGSNEDDSLRQSQKETTESGSMARRNTLAYAPNNDAEDEDQPLHEILKMSMASGTSLGYASSSCEDDIVETTPKGSKLWLPEAKNKPVLGTTFDSVEEAFQFYKAYAIEAGFEVKRGGVWNPKKQLNPKLKFFYCVREGFKPAAKKDHSSTDQATTDDHSSTDQATDDHGKPDGKLIKRRKRASCRCGCKAQLRLKRIAGNKYMVYKFVEKHNHCLVHEDDIKYLRTCRKLTYPKQLLLHQLSNVNLGPVRSFKVMKEMYGGFENIGATSVDCKNFRRDMNNFIGNRDAHMVVEKLLGRAEFFPDFSVEYKQDKDDKSLVGPAICSDTDFKKRLLTMFHLGEKINCICLRYERYGLLCRHIFYVLRLSKVHNFPKSYLQKRWSKDAMTHKSAGRSVEVGSSSNARNGSDSLIRDIYGKVEESVNRLVGDFDRLQLYRDDQDALLEKAKSDVPNPPDMNKNHMYASLLGVTEPEEVTIHLPTGI